MIGICRGGSLPPTRPSAVRPAFASGRGIGGHADRHPRQAMAEDGPARQREVRRTGRRRKPHSGQRRRAGRARPRALNERARLELEQRPAAARADGFPSGVREKASTRTAREPIAAARCRRCLPRAPRGHKPKIVIGDAAAVRGRDVGRPVRRLSNHGRMTNGSDGPRRG